MHTSLKFETVLSSYGQDSGFCWNNDYFCQQVCNFTSRLKDSVRRCNTLLLCLFIVGSRCFVFWNENFNVVRQSKGVDGRNSFMKQKLKGRK